MAFSCIARFFQAKNKVMAVAFGRTEDDQYMENMGEIGKLLNKSGEKGVLFTNRSAKASKSTLRTLNNWTTPEAAPWR